MCLHYPGQDQTQKENDEPLMLEYQKPNQLMLEPGFSSSSLPRKLEDGFRTSRLPQTVVPVELEQMMHVSNVHRQSINDSMRNIKDRLNASKTRARLGLTGNIDSTQYLKILSEHSGSARFTATESRPMLQD